MRNKAIPSLLKDILAVATTVALAFNPILPASAQNQPIRVDFFFHGEQAPPGFPKGGFDNFASLGLAWSDDLKSWDWPRQNPNPPAPAQAPIAAAA